jgi:hypothetical protein
VVLAIIGSLAFFVITSLTGVFRSDPNSIRYVELHYENGTALQTLSNGETAGPIKVIITVPYNSVIVSWAIPQVTHTNYRTLALHVGESLENCAGKVTLKQISVTEATFEFKKGWQCPICMVQGILMRMPDSNLEAP